MAILINLPVADYRASHYEEVQNQSDQIAGSGKFSHDGTVGIGRIGIDIYS
jgi:PDZ domain-containing secreted protein